MPKTTLFIIAVGLVLGTGVRHAGAQVCGDADDSGAVTVTDGVQVLRAAAGLSTTCLSNRCDIDGSGSITVTDGVNVLRKAAGLTTVETCFRTSRQVIAGFLGELTKIPGVLTASSAVLAITGAATTACDEGFFEQEQTTNPFSTKITFFDCRDRNTVINGSYTTTIFEASAKRQASTTTYEAFEAHYIDADVTVRQNGTMEQVLDIPTKLLVENGTLAIFHSRSASGQDEYTLTKTNFTRNIDTNEVVAGELASALVAAGLENLKAVTLGFVTGSVADVDVEFEDGSHAAFTYDLETKELTPASIALADRVGVSERRAAVNDRRRNGRMSA